MTRGVAQHGGGDASVHSLPSAGLRSVQEDFDPSYFLYERYSEQGRRSRLLSAYYTAKPLIPRRLQLAVRRVYARRRGARAFPAWPIEPILVEHQHSQLRRQLRESESRRIPLVNFWPHARQFCVIVTHDVEGPAGIANISRVLEVERRHGFISAWNFVAEGYEVPSGLFDEIRAGGCEIGLHGIKHDGRLFRDRAHFEADLPKIHGYLREWGAVGFRSPATHRNAAWMPELGCLYDGSFPDTDPFEPQPGGCCSILPFFIGEMVELPITLVQDHTLFEILREPSIALWKAKSDWIIRNHGLVHLVVHPDYLCTGDRLAAYDEFLEFLHRQERGWHALPKEVAHWWKARAGLRCESVPGEKPRIVGESCDGATVAYAREESARIVFDL